MNCEICGSEADRKAEIARLPEEMRLMLIEDFSRAIKTAREKRHLSQEQFASAAKEKVSILKRIEEGWNPLLQTARKLEVFFGLNLIDKVQDNAEKLIKGKSNKTR